MGWQSKVLKTGLDVALNGAGAIGDYNTRREEGHGVVSSVAKSALSFGIDTLMFMAPPQISIPYMVMQTAGAVVEGIAQYGKTGGKEEARKVSSVYKHSIGGHFVDTQNAATMRQKGLQAMEQSGYNISSVFGSEARTFHRGAYR